MIERVCDNTQGGHVNARSILVVAAMCIAGLSFAADKPLPNVFEVHFSIEGADGIPINASAIVIEGAKARVQTADRSGKQRVRLQFSVAQDQAATSATGKEIGLVDLSVSKEIDGAWRDYGHPAFSVALGSDKPASLAFAHGKEQLQISARVIKLDSAPFADRIAFALSHPAQCDKPAPLATEAATLKIAATPAAIPDKCCCSVSCPGGPTWTCCNVLSCSCGENTCSPPGGQLCY